MGEKEQPLQEAEPIEIGGIVRDLNLLEESPAYQWKQVSGPGEVFFENDKEPRTTVTFSAAGTYVLRLRVTGLTNTLSDKITIESLGTSSPTKSPSETPTQSPTKSPTTSPTKTPCQAYGHQCFHTSECCDPSHICRWSGLYSACRPDPYSYDVEKVRLGGSNGRVRGSITRTRGGTRHLLRGV